MKVRDKKVRKVKAGPDPTRQDPTRTATGVYAIKNIKNGKVYVGSSAKCLSRRMKRHRSSLVGNSHVNKHLQASWNKHGEEAFEFLVLEGCRPEECLAREQYWIDRTHSTDRKYGYNSSPVAGSQLGFKHSRKTKNKLSKIKTGIRYSEETRAKVALASTGRPVSEKHRKKLSELMKGNKLSVGRKLPPDHIAKLIEANKNRKITPEYRQKLSEAHKHQKPTEEMKRRISETQKAKAKTEEGKALIAKMRAAITKESYRKIGEANRRRVISEETRMKLSISARRWRREKQK